MKQKQIKAIKKQIVEESAINVGYYETVIPAIIENIDPDTFYHLMGRSSGEWLLEAAKSNNRAEFQNILVSEAVKAMSYSEFKTIAHYFFSYQQTSEEIIASPLEVTNNLFNTIQQDANEIFNTTLTEGNDTQMQKDKLLDSIKLQTIEFTNEYDGDENNMGKIPWNNLELQIESIEPNSWPDDGKYFVRAALVDRQDDVIDEVILTPFIVEISDYTEEKWNEWFDTHADKVENIIFSNTEVKALLEELDYRKLPADERQVILDEKNGLINLFDDQTQEPIILGIENYEKYTVEYHPAFENNRATVNISTGEKDISFAKDEDGELIVAASHQVDNLSNDEKRLMKEIAEFKINHPEKSMDEFTTNFESIQNQILEELGKAQSDFKQRMLEKSPSEIFDYASKILYVSDALFELEHFVEEFTPEDYQDHSYSYEKQLGALFERYDSDSPENGSETFMVAAERAWYDSSVNYEVGSDDKADFMENYIADYFGLSPYLKPQETKGVEMTNAVPQNHTHNQNHTQYKKSKNNQILAFYFWKGKI